MPDVTTVHPRADGELPASICESKACAPGSTIDSPSTIAPSKRVTSAFCIKSCDEQATHGISTNPFPLLPRWRSAGRGELGDGDGARRDERRQTSICSGVSSLHHSLSVSANRRPCVSCAAAAPSKPYSRPKRSHTAKTAGVESMSVLKRERFVG